ncbi:MAG: hypothetical protein U0165_05090 [Polyangiaceae bacterium]
MSETKKHQQRGARVKPMLDCSIRGHDAREINASDRSSIHATANTGVAIEMAIPIPDETALDAARKAS